MNKIDKQDYQGNGYGISDAKKRIAGKILEALGEIQDYTNIDIQDFDVEVYINSDPFRDDPTAYVIDIQIKGLLKDGGK